MNPEVVTEGSMRQKNQEEKPTLLVKKHRGVYSGEVRSNSKGVAKGQWKHKMINHVGHQEDGVECDESQRKVAVGSSVSLV